MRRMFGSESGLARLRMKPRLTSNRNVARINEPVSLRALNDDSINNSQLMIIRSTRSTSVSAGDAVRWIEQSPWRAVAQRRRQSRIFLASPRHRAREAQCGIALPGEGK